MENISNSIPLLIDILIFVLGLSVGGFLNVVIYRLPREDENLSLAKPAHSFCPVCGHTIRFYDNIPVLSWLILRARCRDCGEPISVRYPLVELAAGLLALYLYQQFGASFYFLGFFYFTMCLLAIALIDLDLMVIPTVLMYPTIAIGLICAALGPGEWQGAAFRQWAELSDIWILTQLEPRLGLRFASFTSALIGLLLGWGSLKAISVTYKLLRGHTGLGDGDPPLLGLIGVFLGWLAVPFVILASSLIGLISLGILMLTSKKSPAGGWGMKALPFGPFLVLAAFFYLFFGARVIAWYLSLF